MEEAEWEKLIRTNLILLTQNTTNIGILLIYLIQYEVILPNEKQQIESHSNDATQLYELFQLIVKRGSHVRPKLVDALKNTCNSHIAQIFENNHTSNRATIIFELPKTLGEGEQNGQAEISVMEERLRELSEKVSEIESIITSTTTGFVNIKEERPDDTNRAKPTKELALTVSDKNGSLNTVKILKAVFIGDGAVGKTCLQIVMTIGKFPSEYVPTVFSNYETVIKVGENIVQLAVFDTGGQEEYERLRPLSYPGTDMFVLVFSVVNPSSFENILQKWFPEAKHYRGHSVIILVGNQVDLRNDAKTIERLQRSKLQPIMREDGESLATKIHASAYIECSALSGEGVQKLMETFSFISTGMKLNVVEDTNKECCQTCSIS